MAEFKDIFFDLRSSMGFNQDQMAQELHVSKATIGMWEIGERKPGPDKYEEIADYFNVDMDYLYGRSPIKQKISYDSKGQAHHNIPVHTINVLGRVAAGIPINAVEEIIDTEEITEEMAQTGEFFGLLIRGHSMEPRICDGDVVIVRQQDDAESGDIVIVTVNGDEATCKRLKKYHDGIELIANNPSYDPLFFDNTEIQAKPVRIIGKVVELRGKF